MIKLKTRKSKTVIRKARRKRRRHLRLVREQLKILSIMFQPMRRQQDVLETAQIASYPQKENKVVKWYHKLFALFAR